MEGPGDIIGPIGTLVGLGVVAYGAKKVIDVTADSVKGKKQKEVKQRKDTKLGFDTNRAVKKMLS